LQVCQRHLPKGFDLLISYRCCLDMAQGTQRWGAMSLPSERRLPTTPNLRLLAHSLS
jgi:hypothetical protein